MRPAKHVQHLTRYRNQLQPLANLCAVMGGADGVDGGFFGHTYPQPAATFLRFTRNSSRRRRWWRMPCRPAYFIALRRVVPMRLAASAIFLGEWSRRISRSDRKS